MRLANLIRPYDPAEGPPPRRLWPFFRWALTGTFPIIVLASVLAGSVGTLEAFTALVLGVVIDAVVISGPERFLAENAIAVKVTRSLAVSALFVIILGRFRLGRLK